MGLAEVAGVLSAEELVAVRDMPVTTRERKLEAVVVAVEGEMEWSDRRFWDTGVGEGGGE